MKYVVAINKNELMITKTNAELELMIPAGISLLTVLSLAESILLSKKRLNAMAALLANIIQHNIKIKSRRSNVLLFFFTARKNPIMAKGRAKTVWLNFTRDKYFETVFNFYLCGEVIMATRT